jgi:hypothetical protein
LYHNDYLYQLHPLHFGGKVTFLDRNDEACIYCKNGIDIPRCTSNHNFPFLGSSLSSYLWSTIPTRKKESLEHLDFAIKESREMKIQPSLERA